MTLFIKPLWNSILEQEIKKEYFLQIVTLNKTTECFPKNKKATFRIFNTLDLNEIKVIILGQDPYHTPGVATGRCFESFIENKEPPSLRNIRKELNNQGYKYNYLDSKVFDNWESQGVFLLNTALTVEKNKPNSHSEIWEPFTKKVIKSLLEFNKPKVFILWGKKAKDLIFNNIDNNLTNKEEKIKDKGLENKGLENKIIELNPDYFTYKNNLLLTSAHPSPFSADKGFFKNNHFNLANEYLISKNETPINW